MKRNNIYNLLEDYLLENQAPLYRLAYSYVKNKEDALDIIQESFYKAFNSIEKLQNATDIKPWLYRIVINTAIDFLRKNQRITVMEEDKLESYSQATVDTYQDLDLQTALDNLSTNYKTIIILRYFEDLKLSEIAQLLDENINTIKTRLYAGLKKLRMEMEE